MPDRLNEVKRRAMLALRRGGQDITDPVDGRVTGIRVFVGDTEICTTDTVKLLIRIHATNKDAYSEWDDGSITVCPPELDAVLEILRSHQVLDDLAGS